MSFNKVPVFVKKNQKTLKVWNHCSQYHRQQKVNNKLQNENDNNKYHGNCYVQQKLTQMKDLKQNWKWA